MGIEDIPEMHLVDDFATDLSLADVTSGGKRFLGKFVVMQGPNSRPYLFAMERSFSHKQVAGVFSERVEKTWGVSSDGFKTLNGGVLKIDAFDIYVYEKSVDFGKYDELVVRPIVERFKQRYLPNHGMDFK